jgi:hypothetical protein
MRDKYIAMVKIKKVLESCETLDQFEYAIKWARSYVDKIELKDRWIYLFSLGEMCFNITNNFTNINKSVN